MAHRKSVYRPSTGGLSENNRTNWLSWQQFGARVASPIGTH